ncbi:hypothetical protein [Rikenella microfusus]|uniref:Uncharacterized protein n=1 Tax=Rikenella microfusus TaxID=28139 RepID=A0A379MQS7_9BACT|nr:hypothetical protein [Rikenella microfusus]SUE33873.1 Uncharacterised protein [Rikenella microfusus]
MIGKDFFFSGGRMKKQPNARFLNLISDLSEPNLKWVENDGYYALLPYLAPQHFYAVNVLIIKNVQHHGKENILRGLLQRKSGYVL